MNRWGNRQQEEPEGLNLPQIVNSTPSAYQLLQISNLPEEVKSKSTQFTQLYFIPYSASSNPTKNSCCSSSSGLQLIQPAI